MAQRSVRASPPTTVGRGTRAAFRLDAQNRREAEIFPTTPKALNSLAAAAPDILAR
ncbi:MAG: hypothetical protein ACI8VE_002189 [Natrialbaceae archaeon]